MERLYAETLGVYADTGCRGRHFQAADAWCLRLVHHSRARSHSSRAASARSAIPPTRVQDIPLADAELCFPDKSVHLKPFVFVRMLAAAAGAAAAGWLAWSKGGGTLSRGLAGSLATLLGGRAMSLLTTVFYHRARMAGEMERMQVGALGRAHVRVCIARFVCVRMCV